LTLIHSSVAGGDCIDDADMLRMHVHEGDAEAADTVAFTVERKSYEMRAVAPPSSTSDGGLAPVPTRENRIA